MSIEQTLQQQDLNTLEEGSELGQAHLGQSPEFVGAPATVQFPTPLAGQPCSHCTIFMVSSLLVLS